MDLSPKLLQEFANLVNKPTEEKPSTQVYGTIKVDNEQKFVQLDGSECLTPISEVVDAQAGDRVLVSIENHRATIVGNFTYPPSARTANEAKSNADEAISKSESAEEKAKDALDATEEYSEQISAANAAANEAKTNASTASGLATEASNKANEVYVLAEEAKSAASKAETDAASAMTNVDAANKALSALQTEVSGVKTDISTIRSGVQSDLETFTETISATYAGKTDLTTLEGTLKAEISKSAGELRTTMSEQYVAKSDHVTIQANLQTQITANAEGISSSAKKITKLETDTTEAQKAIDAAQKDADDALAAAGEAQTKANAAQTTANEATAKANAADAALTQAKADLATAQANLAEVTGRVDATEEEIAEAQKAVTAAEEKVEQAKKDAAAAQTAAGEAKTAASTAQTKATEAKSAADKAQADADALKSRVSTAETKITQNAEAITSTATLAGEAKSAAEQTATKFSWIVKSGTSSSNFELTDRTFTLVAQNIDLTGKVTFSSFDSSTQSKINTAASDASTAKSTASTANTTANTAKTTASTASTNASTALSTANTAKSTADTAKSTADTAKTTANTASTNASTALSTANTAKSTADAANTAASAAATQLAAWCHTNGKTLIDGGKIYTGSITATQIAARTITASEIKTSTITANEIAANTITAAEIAANAITSSELSSNSVTADKIVAGAITADKIAAKAITADKLSVTSLSAICATIGGFTIDANVLYATASSNACITAAFSVGSGGKGNVYIGNVTTDSDSETKGLYVVTYDSSNNISYKVMCGSVSGGAMRIKRATGTYDSMLIKNDEIRLETITSALKLPNPITVNSVVNISSTSIHSTSSTKLLIGTTTYPTSHHYLDNNTSIYGRNAAGTDYIQLIRASSGNNILVGYYNNKSEDTLIYMGYQKTFYVNSGNSGGTGGENQLVLGYDSAQSSYTFRVPCIKNVTTSGGYNVRVDNSGFLFKYASSSRRYKEAISEKISEHLNPHKLYNIPVVEFIYKESHLSKRDQRYGQKFIGFIAEDIDDIYPIAANYNDDGSVEDWNIHLMVPGMLKLIQEQHKVDITLNSQVETLKNQLDEAMIKIASLEKQIDILKTA